MSQFLEDVLARHGPLEALVDGNKRLTFSELGALVQAMAAALRQLGLERGDRVVLWGENGWRWETTAMACWWSGLVVVPISNRLKSLEVLPLLQELEPGAVVAGRDNQGNGLLESLSRHLEEEEQTLEGSLPGTRAFIDLRDGGGPPWLSWDHMLHEHSRTPGAACAGVEPNDTCLILYTSGTTGKPKGVATSNKALLRAFVPLPSNIERPGDRYLLNTPLSHMYGQYIMIRSLMVGICQVFGVGATADDVARLVRQESITLLTGPPSLFQELLMHRRDGRTLLKGVREISSGGAPLPEKLVLEMINTGVERVRVGYGLTEYPRVTSSRPGDKVEHICGTVGRPRPWTRLKIVDGQNHEVAEGEVGEIAVSGDFMMQGYWGQGGVIEPAVDEEGWFYTGDLGRIIDGEHLQIVGRKKEMYISHGFNVYPAEVENLLLKSGLLQSVAVISRASRLVGEEGVAVIVPKQTETFDLHQLRNWAHRNLANYKVPTRYIVTEGLPLNASGKVDKLALRARYLPESERELSMLERKTAVGVINEDSVNRAEEWVCQ
jgi:acyl-CoA synthetase (AMP-forming)/AMP-acid ligase II